MIGEKSHMGLLISLALRTIGSHKSQSLLVGFIIAGSTLLLLVGSSLLHSVEQTMAKSVTSSVAGHLQIYDKNAKDKLSLFGSGFIGIDDIGRIDNFETIKQSLMKLPEIKAVVPMGPLICSVHQETQLDKQLRLLKKSFETHQIQEQQTIWQDIKLLLGYLIEHLQRQKAIALEQDTLVKQIESIQFFLSSSFQELLQRNPEQYILDVESIAGPLWEDGRLLYLRSIGTDLPQFTQLFDRLKLLRGEHIQEGQRGILLSSRTVERFLKHKIARDLDAISEGLSRRRSTIALDPTLLDLARRLPQQAKSLLLQITPIDRRRLQDYLQIELASQQTDITLLLQEFLEIHDNNFQQRYKQFYQDIVPLIKLYLFDVGDTITLSSFSRTGYRRSANVKIFGIYQFQGLEDSDLAGVFNLLDMETFRDLYGTLTIANRLELAELKQELGVQAIDRATAEDALFGEEVDSKSNQLPIGERGNLPGNVESSVDQESGFAIHAAIILQDVKQLSKARQSLQELIARENLPIQVLDWQEASGAIGQFIWVIRGVLSISLAIVLLVAMVIVNNAMVMATLKRVREIGTMRAIGAQRWFVVQLVVLETTVLGLVAGSLGIVMGLVLLRSLQTFGIPATNDIMTFLFSGKYLYPVYSWSEIITSLVIVVLLAILSSLYPVRLALRVSPVLAMQSKE